MSSTDSCRSWWCWALGNRPLHELAGSSIGPLSGSLHILLLGHSFSWSGLRQGSLLLDQGPSWSCAPTLHCPQVNSTADIFLPDDGPFVTELSTVAVFRKPTIEHRASFSIEWAPCQRGFNCFLAMHAMVVMIPDNLLCGPLWQRHILRKTCE